MLLVQGPGFENQWSRLLYLDGAPLCKFYLEMIPQIVSLSNILCFAFLHSEVYGPLIQIFTLLNHSFPFQCHLIPTILMEATRLSLIISYLFCCGGCKLISDIATFSQAKL